MSSHSRHPDGLPGDSELNRRILALLAGFRLLVATGLVLVASMQGTPPFLGERYPLLFITVSCVYAVIAVIIGLTIRSAKIRPLTVSWGQLITDISCIVLIVHSNGGAGAGIEALMVAFVVALGMTLSARGAYLAAAVAALAVLFEQSLSFLEGATGAEQFITAGTVGAIMLALAAVTQPLVRRAAETAELARQRGIDLENLAQLNDYVVQNLREAILVIDEDQTIRLVNQTAIERLGTRGLNTGDHLDDALPQLQGIYNDWRAGKLDLAREIPNFLSADGNTVINAHFAQLGEGHEGGPVLVFLEDASLLQEKVQQSKLAALGRLSASIAHEIRNPVGALSHAAQLLGESPDIKEQDQRFIDIINTNSKRVSEIIDNILQLSRKETAQPVRLQLNDWVDGFVKEFVSTLELFEGQLDVAAGEPVEVRMDPSHLHQVAWNLCENAVKYASETAGGIAVELRYGRMSNNNRPFLEISDQGPGIPVDMQDSVFEPFSTGRSGGTGLGLYICRELCERNKASLRYRSREGGGSIFQIVFDDPERWEIQEDR
jgi:two-component system sensor histidine kinase PilS (NtrC family)